MSKDDKNLIDRGPDRASGKIFFSDYLEWEEIKQKEKALLKSIVTDMRPDLVHDEIDLTKQLKDKPPTPEKFRIYKARRKVRNELTIITNRVRKELNDGLNSYIQWGD